MMVKRLFSDWDSTAAAIVLFFLACGCLAGACAGVLITFSAKLIFELMGAG